ncbi:MAG: sigma-54 dependent transcriptional regulator [Desulfovibrionaceae bacterium]|nr:sigma-54 dependent transcriptional regulator [Desulfovibrionaceae bacterium]
MYARRILFIAPTQTVTRLFPELREAGFEVGIAENVKGAAAFIRKTPPGVILSRPGMPGYKVEDLLSVGQEDPAFPPVVVFTDKGDVEEASRIMSLGAKDYWLEPLFAEKIAALLPARKEAPPAPPNSVLGRSRPSAQTRIIGEHPALRRVLSLAMQVAKSRATVLISGASGTGKEMFARYLHAQSDRAAGPFIAVNCAALPEHLLESELFGHEKGAFTGAIARKLGKFELASGGSMLLDEISEMDLALQAKLLRALQENQIDRVGGAESVNIDVRVLATTNRDLETWVEEGKFRQDLFFRLNVIPLRLPALKERAEDALLLANFFLQLYVDEYRLPPTSLSDEAAAWIMDYAWPGNVRELQNLMERATLLCGGKPILPAHFLLDQDSWPFFVGDEGFQAGDGVQSAGSVNGGESGAAFSGGVIPLHEMERIMIIKGLEQTRGNRTQAAELLGISVRTLRNKLNEYREQGRPVEAGEEGREGET